MCVYIYIYYEHPYVYRYYYCRRKSGPGGPRKLGTQSVHELRIWISEGLTRADD